MELLVEKFSPLSVIILIWTKVTPKWQSNFNTCKFAQVNSGRKCGQIYKTRNTENPLRSEFASAIYIVCIKLFTLFFSGVGGWDRKESTGSLMSWNWKIDMKILYYLSDIHNMWILIFRFFANQIRIRVTNLPDRIFCPQINLEIF